jgi:hypothetical protein
MTYRIGTQLTLVIPSDNDGQIAGPNRNRTNLNKKTGFAR